MKKQSYTIERSSLGKSYLFPHYPEKYKTETIHGRICKKAGHKVSVKVKKLVAALSENCENDRAAIKKAKENYPELKNFKGQFRFKIKVNGKSCGTYKYGNKKIKLRVLRTTELFRELLKYFPSTRIAVPEKLKSIALKFWGATYFKWHLKGFKKEWSNEYSAFVLREEVSNGTSN